MKFPKLAPSLKKMTVGNELTLNFSQKFPNSSISKSIPINYHDFYSLAILSKIGSIFLHGGHHSAPNLMIQFPFSIIFSTSGYV